MKIKHYNDAIDWLTRPKFNGGGSVKNKEVLPKRKPEEELKKRKKKRFEKLKEYLENPEEVEEMLELQDGGRTSYGVGGITLNKKGPYKGYYAVTKKRDGKNFTFRDKDKSVVEKQLQEFMDAKGPQGGAAVKTKRTVEGVSEKNLTKLREIITNKAKERNLPPPDFEKYPGRGYPSNTPGNIMAKDLIRGIKKTGTRGGKDFKTVGTGTGSKALTNPLSKPEKELLEKTFSDVDFDFTKSRFGIDRKVNPELYRQAVNLVKENPKLVFGFQFMKPENYLLTTFQRARLQQLADTGVSEYVPIYKNQKIIGFQDNTKAGGGKKFYHSDYKGGTSIKAHPNFKKVAKYVDIVKDTRGDHIPVLNKLFTDAGEKVPTFDQLLNDLLDSPSRGGPGSISAAIEKHHTKGVKTSPADLQLLTRDKNKLAALIEGRVDAGKMDLQTAGRILKPEGIQIERGGVKVGAPDIAPEKQVKDLKKFVERKTLEKFAERNAKNVTQLNFKFPIISTMYDVAKSIPGDLDKAKYLSAGFKTLGLAVAPYVAYKTFQNVMAGKNLAEALERNLIGTDIIGGTKDILAMTPEEREARAKVKQEQIAELNIDMPTGFGFIEAPPVQTDMSLEEAKQKFEAGKQRVAQERAEREAGVAAVRKQAFENIKNRAAGYRPTAMKLAGGGLLKQAGKRSGPPPEKGPGGLASLEDYARTMME